MRDKLMSDISRAHFHRKLLRLNVFIFRLRRLMCGQGYDFREAHNPWAPG